MQDSPCDTSYRKKTLCSYLRTPRRDYRAVELEQGWSDDDY